MTNPATKIEPLYYGCWGSIGHYFYTPDMQHVAGPLTPWGWGVERLCPVDTSAQNAAALWQKDGWTALAVHDYTVDHRGNSKSVFCFPEHIDTIPGAWARAREVFPEVVARLDATTSKAAS